MNLESRLTVAQQADYQSMMMMTVAQIHLQCPVLLQCLSLQTAGALGSSLGMAEALGSGLQMAGALGSSLGMAAALGSGLQMAGVLGSSLGMAVALGSGLQTAGARVPSSAPLVQQEQVRQNWTPSHHRWTTELWTSDGPDCHQYCSSRPCYCLACASELASDETSPSAGGECLQWPKFH